MAWIVRPPLAYSLKLNTALFLFTGLLVCSNPGEIDKTNIATAGSVALTGSTGSGRAAHTATLLTNGKVLIAGGMERNHVFFASAELYDPATGKFTATGNMTVKRVAHKAVLLRNGKVLIVGGMNHEDGELASAELYDPATGTFSRTGNMHQHGVGFVDLLPDGRALVMGGPDNFSVDIYDPITGLFTSTGWAIKGPDIATQLTLLKSGRVLLTGIIKSSLNETATVETAIYDPSTGVFTPSGNMTAARIKHSTTVLQDGRVLITGGLDRNGVKGRSNSAEIFDPTKGTFTAVGNMGLTRFKHQAAAVLLPNGKVLVAGGGERVEIFDPATNTFTTASGALDDARFFSTATLLQNGTVLIVGGYRNGITTTTDAWIYRTTGM